MAHDLQARELEAKGDHATVVRRVDQLAVESRPLNVEADTSVETHRATDVATLAIGPITE